MDIVFVPLGNVPWHGTAGSCGSSMFRVLKNGQTIFQSGCAIFNPNSLRVPIRVHYCKAGLYHWPHMGSVIKTWRLEGEGIFMELVDVGFSLYDNDSQLGSPYPVSIAQF